MDEDIIRFVEAVALGQIADEEFEQECQRLGIKTLDGSPLDEINKIELPFILGRPQA